MGIGRRRGGERGGSNGCIKKDGTCETRWKGSPGACAKTATAAGGKRDVVVRTGRREVFIKTGSRKVFVMKRSRDVFINIGTGSNNAL